MANTITIRLDGFKQVADRLREIGPEVTRHGLAASAYAGADLIRNEVRAKTPVRTGALRESISVFKRRSPPEQALYAVGTRQVILKYANTRANRRSGKVGKRFHARGPTFYGKFVEFGTSKMSARPFMRPAFAAAARPALERMREGLSEALAKAVRRLGGR